MPKKREKHEYRSYIVATARRSKRLDSINRIGGRIYSKTVALTQKTHDTKGFWLSDSGLKKYLRHKGYPCHSHSVQAIIDDYCGARRAFFEIRKADPESPSTIQAELVPHVHMASNRYHLQAR